MKEITEDYVSFETRTLLMKKGMPKDCFNHLARENTQEDIIRTYYTCPLYYAIKWLREQGFYIKIDIDVDYDEDEPAWDWLVFRIDERKQMSDDGALYATYEQAAEAAIKYCLKNLI